MRSLLRCLYFVAFFALARCSNITPAVFGKVLDGMPAAFGDFNSDELTDVFVLREDGRIIEIMLASDQEPLLQPGKGLRCSFENNITSVVPGDFDGDAFMDVLVTTKNFTDRSPNAHIVYAHVLWGENGELHCSNESEPMIEMHGQPLAIDYNQDMIIDLFGSDTNDKRKFWVFNQNRTKPHSISMEGSKIRRPHSNAFLDLNEDFIPDLFITTEDKFEIWLGQKDEGFVHNTTIERPDIGSSGHIGQSLFLDVELTGKMVLILPVCYDKDCRNSSILIYSDGWHNLQVGFTKSGSTLYGFVPNNGRRYTDTITLRGGDFNMDGYPDLLATLQTADNECSTFLLQNVQLKSDNFNRTFQIQWEALYPFKNETVMAVFYDFYQDGILDVIMVEYDKMKKIYQSAAFKNSLDYDANFVKVMVLTGLTNSKFPIPSGTLSRKKRTYGTNLPGPSISYKTTSQDGSPRSASAAQLPQSAHFSLNLPYTTFGLGRMPNFVETLTIGIKGESRGFPQIIPNSQMVVIPKPLKEPLRWKVQLFMTPSKLILLSVAALTGTCGLIIAIIMGLYWKERREDKIEKLQEAHRFHFDAM